MELLITVLGIVDDPLDFVRNPHICLFQKFRSDRLFLRIWPWLLSLTSQNQSPACRHSVDGSDPADSTAVGGIAGDDQPASRLRGSKCGNAGLGYPVGP